MTSQSLETNYDVTIEFLPSLPNTRDLLATPDTPGKVYAYYNAALDGVYLFVIDPTGLRILAV